MPWIVWFLAAIALLIAEAFVPGFFLACLGIAAGGAAVAAALGLSAPQQVGIFAALTLLSYVAFRPVFEALFHPTTTRVTTNAQALIGQQGLVVVDVRGGPRGGRVVVGGDDWRAVPEDDETIPEGDTVVVTAITGATLTVRRKVRS